MSFKRIISGNNENFQLFPDDVLVIDNQIRIPIEIKRFNIRPCLEDLFNNSNSERRSIGASLFKQLIRYMLGSKSTRGIFF